MLVVEVPHLHNRTLSRFSPSHSLTHCDCRAGNWEPPIIGWGAFPGSCVCFCCFYLPIFQLICLSLLLSAFFIFLFITPGSFFPVKWWILSDMASQKIVLGLKNWMLARNNPALTFACIVIFMHIILCT